MKLSSKWEESIILYLYDELEPEERSAFESELERNPAVRARVEKMRRFHNLLDRKGTPEPSERVLQRSRARLLLRLRQTRAAALPSERPRRSRTWFEPRPGFIVAGAAALLVAGFLAGRLSFHLTGKDGSELARYAPSTRPSAVEQGDLITDIDLIQYDPKSGIVTVQYTSLHDVVVEGDMADPAIRKLLAYAIRADDHPGRRLTAVKATRGYGLPDAELEAALIRAMRTDSIPGVRLKAAKVLESLPPTAKIRQAFIGVLQNEPNPAIRIEALQALESHRSGDQLVPVFQHAMATDTNDFVRLEAAKALKRTRYTSVRFDNE